MEFPTIKFNIFKKLEYFEQLRKINQQFWIQLELLEKYRGGVFPTWEFEKKVLFYTYANHKHLGSPFALNDFKTGEEWLRSRLWKGKTISRKQAHNLNITALRNRPEFTAKKSDFRRHNRRHRLKDAFLCQNEVINAGLKETFESLEQRGFSELIPTKGFRITQEGLAFGELLWSLYFPKINKRYSKIYGRSPRKFNRPVDKNLYMLSPGYLKWFGLYLQALTAKTFYLLAVTFVSSQVIDWMGLSEELKDLIKKFVDNSESKINFTKNVFLFLVIFPVVLFFSGIVLESLGGFGNKHRRIQILLGRRVDSFRSMVRSSFVNIKKKWQKIKRKNTTKS